MNAEQMLAETARLHAEHMDRVADRVSVDLSDSHPHGDRSDYNEHHADVSAPPQVDDQLNRRLAALIERYQRANGID